MEMPMYMNESKSHLLYVLQEYINLCHDKGTVFKNYPPENIYREFRNIPKGVIINTWNDIIANGKNTHDNFYRCYLGAMRAKYS